jgi:kynurenine formamidase
MRLIDLSHVIAPGMPLFSASAPQPEVRAWMSHAQAAASGRYQECSCEISEARFVISLGTYLDSPYHFNPHGATIEHLRLEQVVLPGVVVDCTFAGPRQALGPHVLDGVAVAGKAVLFRTDWSRHWGQAEYYEFPFLSGETALALRERGAKLAGIDGLVIDDTTDPRRPVHVTLLRHNILIVENLTNLGALPASGFIFHAAPVRLAGAAAFPIRAYAVLQQIPF